MVWIFLALGKTRLRGVSEATRPLAHRDHGCVSSFLNSFFFFPPSNLRGPTFLFAAGVRS